jgi:hypothetical protein
VASSCYSLSLSFIIVKLANDCLTQNNVMFGINRRIGGWWKLLNFLNFSLIFSFFWKSTLGFWFWFYEQVYFGTLRFYFSNWIERLISTLFLHLWTSIYAFVSLFFIIYKSKATHLLMLFKTRDRNLENENP